MSSFIKRFLGRAQFDAEKELESLKEKFGPKFVFPTDLANPMMDYMLERSYLEDVSERTDFCVVPMPMQEDVSWLRIDRLPVSPLRIDDYDLLSRWQGVLSSLHAWNQKLIFLLQRRGGQTHLYIGVQGLNVDECANKCKCALIGSMPGIDMSILNGANDVKEVMAIGKQIEKSVCGGAVTGIPSFRTKTQYSVLQTLDKLAFGFKDIRGLDANYSFIVVAEPLQDAQITEMISKYQKIGSDIHSEVTYHVSESRGISHQEGTTTGGSFGAGMGVGEGSVNILSNLLKTAAYTANPISLPAGMATKVLLKALGLSGNVGFSRSVSSSDSVNYSESVAKDYLNKFAQYTELLTDRHCERLRAGRDIGFWNAGVYVLADSQDNVNLVTGILRSVYSGDQSHIEPIRTHVFNAKSALDTIKAFNLVPIINPDADEFAGDDWHILGGPFQYVSTPVNTEELSLFSSLPRKDVPGIRFVKNAARFANNPGKDTNADDLVKIGHIVDTGVVQSNPYTVSVNSLVRHSLIVGSTGCGKTTTCKTLINAVLEKKKPVLIIEPAKDEWVRWAIKQNEQLPENEKIAIFEPGLTNFEGTHLSNLRLNPFQPAAIDDAPIDMQTRCEKITALINATLPTGDILPVIMDEALYAYLNSKVEDFEEEEQSQLLQYPLLEGALPVAKKLLEARGYERRVTDSFVAALETRFKYMTRGKRGKILNNLISTSYGKLFNHNCVINLSKIPNAKDKALIMSMILLSLYEYRISAYTYDETYRRHTQDNELMHLTVIEEAHNVLARPNASAEGSGNPQQVVADLFSNMLSEIRSLGEGFMIVDQVPTKLIPDVVKNTNYKICHRMTAIDDCGVMAQALALRDDQKGIIPTLEQGNAIVAGDLDDAASWVKISKPIINL